MLTRSCSAPNPQPHIQMRFLAGLRASSSSTRRRGCCLLHRIPPSPQPGHHCGQRGCLSPRALFGARSRSPAWPQRGEGKAWETAASLCARTKPHCVRLSTAGRGLERSTGWGSCAGPSVTLTAIDGGKGPHGKGAFHGELGPLIIAEWSQPRGPSPGEAQSSGCIHSFIVNSSTAVSFPERRVESLGLFEAPLLS